MPGIETLASGLEGGFGVQTFEVLRPYAPRVALVSENDIRSAMRWMASRHQYLIEGSAAAGIAACFQRDVPTPKGPTVVFISGRNIAFETLKSVLCEDAS
jgi:threonine dehydratase